MEKITFSYQNRGGIQAVYAIHPDAIRYLKLNPVTSMYQLAILKSRPVEAYVVEIPVISSGYKWDEEMMRDDRGIYYDISASGMIPRCDESNRSVISILERGKWCLLAKDNNGSLKFSGSEDFPFYFTSSQTTGGNTVDANGCSFIIEGQQPFKSVYIENFDLADL